ncbi:transposase, partial [Faecalibaculum rodentium]
MNRYELREALLDTSPDLRKAYHFRNRLSEYYRKENLSTAEEELRSLIRDLDSTGVEELQSFADTLRNWFREIINSFHIVKQEYVVDPKTGNVRLKEHRLTSSMIENRNKIIKMIKHNANGYTNWERFRNRVLFVLSRGPEDGHP